MNTNETKSRFFGRDDRTVFRIIIGSLSLAFSVLIASLETVRPAPFGFSFRISWNTLVTLAGAAVIVVPCFRTLFLSRHASRRKAALAMVVMIGLASFLYPLRFVPSAKFGEIFIGLAIAVGALSLVGGCLLAINRFLNADQLATEAEAG
jgi:hypothetical protein